MNRISPLKILLTLILLLSACASDQPLGSEAGNDPESSQVDGADIDEEGIDRAQALWRESGIDSYRFTFQRNCECLDIDLAPWTVTVRDGQIENVSSDEFDQPDYITGFTPDDVFDDARAAVLDGKMVNLTLDDNGFPLAATIDVEATEVDGGSIIRMSDFEVLDG